MYIGPREAHVRHDHVSCPIVYMPMICQLLHMFTDGTPYENSTDDGLRASTYLQVPGH